MVVTAISSESLTMTKCSKDNIEESSDTKDKRADVFTNGDSAITDIEKSGGKSQENCPNNCIVVTNEDNDTESSSVGSNPDSSSVGSNSDSSSSRLSLEEHIKVDEHIVEKKGKRKYYWYGNHKLVKPIKEIPPRFQLLLAETNAEKARCEGRPIILQQSLDSSRTDVSSNVTSFNPEAQCFIPGQVFDKIDGNVKHTSKSNKNGVCVDNQNKIGSDSNNNSSSSSSTSSCSSGSSSGNGGGGGGGGNSSSGISNCSFNSVNTSNTVTSNSCAVSATCNTVINNNAPSEMIAPAGTTSMHYTAPASTTNMHYTASPMYTIHIYNSANTPMVNSSMASPASTCCMHAATNPCSNMYPPTSSQQPLQAPVYYTASPPFPQQPPYTAADYHHQPYQHSVGQAVQYTPCITYTQNHQYPLASMPH